MDLALASLREYFICCDGHYFTKQMHEHKTLELQVYSLWKTEKKLKKLFGHNVGPFTPRPFTVALDQTFAALFLTPVGHRIHRSMDFLSFLLPDRNSYIARAARQSSHPLRSSHTSKTTYCECYLKPMLFFFFFGLIYLIYEECDIFYKHDYYF